MKIRLRKSFWPRLGADKNPYAYFSAYFKRLSTLLPLLFLVSHAIISSASEPCTPWQWQKPLPQGSTLNDITYGNGSFVAVGYGGTILMSPDGMAWTPRYSGTTEDLYAVAWNGDVFVASGDGKSDFILRSYDGIQWLPCRAGFSFKSPNNYCQADIAWGGGLFVLCLSCESEEGSAILTSPDGVDWTKRLEIPNGCIRHIMWAGSRFMAVGDRGRSNNGLVLSSADGTLWHVQSNLSDGALRGIAWNGSRYVAVGVREVLTSDDGLEWTERPGVSDLFFFDVYWNGRIFISTARDMHAGGNQILTSPDGEEWTERYRNLDSSLSALAIASYSGVTIAVGEGGSIKESQDGLSWQERTIGDRYWLWDVIWANGQFVAVGWGDEDSDEGAILTSPDGLAWTERHLGWDSYLEAIIWDGRQFVAVGDWGGVFTSPDATNWTMRRFFEPEWLYDIVYTGNLYVVVGSNWQSGDAVILTSLNALEWTLHEAGTRSFLGSVAWNGGRFVAAGMDWEDGSSSIVISEDGENWRRIPPPVKGLNAYAEDVIWNGRQFLMAGYPKALAVSADGLSWSPVAGTDSWVWGLLWDGSQYWAVGAQGEIMRSVDGLAWDRLPPMGSTWFRALANSEERFVAVGHLGAIVTWDCGPLAVEVSASQLCGTAPLAVKFSAQAGGGAPPYTYSWDFGDGAPPSPEQSPAHIYTEPELYSPILTVTDAAGAQVQSEPMTVSVVQVAPPSISSATKKGSPFKVIINGSNIHEFAQVFIGGDAGPWPEVQWKNGGKLVLKGAKDRFPVGVPVEILVKNPNCGTASAIFTR